MALTEADIKGDDGRGPGNGGDGDPDARQSQPGAEERQDDQGRKAMAAESHPHAILRSA